MTSRQRLPNRRPAETFSFRWRGMEYTATTSRFPNGNLSEIFISNGKADTDSDAVAKDAGVVCSLCLQFGCDIETIRKALLRDGRGVAASPLGAALDAIAARDTGNDGVPSC